MAAARSAGPASTTLTATAVGARPARGRHQPDGVTAAGAHDEDEAAAVLVGRVVGIDDGQRR